MKYNFIIPDRRLILEKFNRVIVFVLDGVGVGELPDADQYGDKGSNTMGNLSRKVGGFSLPNMEKIGYGKLTDIQGMDPNIEAIGAYGKCFELSKGKDSTTGHWEIMGVVSENPFPTYPDGFPEDVIKAFENAVGREILYNKPASGTEIISRYGDEHVKTGKPIIYTSADSVFQIAAHEEIIPLEELYDMCQKAREILQGEHGVARVIARPFIGKSGDYRRTPNRKDFSLEPHYDTVMDKMIAKNLTVAGIGKIYDLYGHRGVNKVIKSKSNIDGMNKTLLEMDNVEKGLIFTNLVEFDMLWGHRNDAEGFYKGLQDFDEYLNVFFKKLKPQDLVIFTADHGVDPTTPSTDHSREYIPVIAIGENVTKNLDLGIRKSFADIGATIAEIFDIEKPEKGTSFLKEISNG